MTSFMRRGDAASDVFNWFLGVPYGQAVPTAAHQGPDPVTMLATPLQVVNTTFHIGYLYFYDQ